MILVWPSRKYLDGYVSALERGWSPDNERGEAAALEQLQEISHDADGFLDALVDREAKGGPIKLPDGSEVPRLPGYHRWLWDGEFCGVIGFRWQLGTVELPPTCLGHIGFTVVPWKRRNAYATQALRSLLADVKAEGLKYVELVTEADNGPSQRVVQSNGGILIERFTKGPEYGGTLECMRYRIHF